MAETKERTLEDRVAALEQLLDRAITAAAKHPVGRQVLRILGLS